MTAKGTKVIFGNLYYLKEFLNPFYEDIKKKKKKSKSGARPHFWSAQQESNLLLLECKTSIQANAP